MIRVIVRTMDGSLAFHVCGPGTPAEFSYKTFDIDAPDLEGFLREAEAWTSSGTSRAVVGVEVVDTPTSKREADNGEG